MIRTACCALGLVVVLGACANPADDVPAANVSTSSPAAEAATGQAYTIADSSSIGFIGSKVTGSERGGFRGVEGEISLVDGDVTRSSVNVVIDTTTLWAENDKLAAHLQSADFFDVVSYPEATFTSTQITSEPDGTYLVSGNLDLHGVTKNISFPARIEVQDDQITAQAEFSIKRFDFGITYKGRADDLIRDEVVIQLDLKAAPEVSAS